MKTMKKIKVCPFCRKGYFKTQILNYNIEYLGFTKVENQHYNVCNTCGFKQAIPEEPWKTVRTFLKGVDKKILTTLVWSVTGLLWFLCIYGASVEYFFRKFLQL